MNIVIEGNYKESPHILGTLITKVLKEYSIPINKTLEEDDGFDVYVNGPSFKKEVLSFAKQHQHGISIHVKDLPNPKSNYDISEYLFEDPEDGVCVKGTLVKVGEVISLIIDGNTWSDILRSHPELCEEDIRACVTFAISQEDYQINGLSEENPSERGQEAGENVARHNRQMGCFTAECSRYRKAQKAAKVETNNSTVHSKY